MHRSASLPTKSGTFTIIIHLVFCPPRVFPPPSDKPGRQHYKLHPPSPLTTHIVGEGDDYLVDHSIFFYLTDDRGRFLQYYHKEKTAEEIVEDIVALEIP